MSQLRVPSNVSSITISSVVYTPDANGIVTGESDADDTLITSPYTRPRLVSTAIATGLATILLPSNISSITISSTVYTPDASNQIYNVPDSDTTLLCDPWLGFLMVDAP